MAVNLSALQYDGGFLPGIMLLIKGYYLLWEAHFKCCGRGFVFVAYETTILHLVESPYGSVVKRKSSPITIF